MARRDLAPWDAAMESSTLEFVAESIAAGMSRTAAHAALRDLGLSVPRDIMRELWETGERAFQTYQRERPLSDIRPATEGLTAPAVMRIATDYVYTVELTHPSGRTRMISVATNDASMTAQDVIDLALEIGNDRSRYEAGSAIPPGGWAAGNIESAIHRAA